MTQCISVSVSQQSQLLHAWTYSVVLTGKGTTKSCDSHFSMSLSLYEKLSKMKPENDTSFFKFSDYINSDAKHKHKVHLDIEISSHVYVTQLNDHLISNLSLPHCASASKLIDVLLACFTERK